MAAAVSGRRTDYLARSKPVPPGFLADRRSVYWPDYQPPSPGASTIENCDSNSRLVVDEDNALTPRQVELSGPKQLHQLHRGDRPTSIWPVSESARDAEASSRVVELALARPVHPDHLYERSVFTQVPDAARNARSTPRLASLSEPKAHTMWVNNRDLLQEREFCQPITPICNSALKGRCTPRVENLAESKMTNPDYLGERTVRWPVTDSARNATATLRLQQLSRPKSARLKKDDYDPYRVTLSALKARPAPRLCELSLPIPRKIRPKKN